MGFNTTGLSNYTNQESTDLYIQKVTTQNTAAYASKLPNVKSSFAFHLLLTTPIIQDGEGCGFTASGDVQFTDRTLTTYAYKFEDKLCLRTLEAKWTQKLLTPGQDYQDTDIPAVIMSDLADQMAHQFESYDWTGTIAVNFYDGIQTVVEAANTFTEANVTTYGGVVQSSVTNATIDDCLNNCMNAAIQKFPTWIGQTNVKLFVPMAVIGYYIQYVFNLNNYHIKPVELGKTEYDWVGTPWKIVGVNGLTGTGGSGTKFWMFETDNLFLGFDAASDETSARLWYSQDNDDHRYSFRGRRGWNTPYPQRFIRHRIA